MNLEYADHSDYLHHHDCYSCLGFDHNRKKTLVEYTKKLILYSKYFFSAEYWACTYESRPLEIASLIFKVVEN